MHVTPPPPGEATCPNARTGTARISSLRTPPASPCTVCSRLQISLRDRTGEIIPLVVLKSGLKIVLVMMSCLMEMDINCFRGPLMEFSDVTGSRQRFMRPGQNRPAWQGAPAGTRGRPRGARSLPGLPSSPCPRRHPWKRRLLPDSCPCQSKVQVGHLSIDPVLKVDAHFSICQ